MTHNAATVGGPGEAAALRWLPEPARGISELPGGIQKRKEEYNASHRLMG
jgi:hypothetical protein